MLGAPHMVSRVSVVAVAFLLAAATLPLVTLGQATPEAEVVAPKPDECVVEPRKFQLPGAAATPIAAPSGELPGPSSVPTGEPADPAQVEAVTAVAREALACRNAGDLRRAYALMSDRLIESLLGGIPGPAPELLYLLENRSERVSRGERLDLVSVGDVQLLEDGRIRAEVTTRNMGTVFVDILLFAPATEGDGWLIDESVAVSRTARP